MKKFDVYYDDKFIDSIYAENGDEAEEIYDIPIEGINIIEDEDYIDPDEEVEE